MIEITLAKALEDRGKTMYWLAKHTGMSYDAIANLCKKQTQRIEFTTLNLICRELKCKPGDVLSYVADEVDER